MCVVLRPFAENTFAESQFEECLFAEKNINRRSFLPKCLFAEILSFSLERTRGGKINYIICRRILRILKNNL
jgi:hypothetical protein